MPTAHAAPTISSTRNKTPVLVDASSAILLFKADLFDLLTDSFRVILADSVYTEVTKGGYPGAAYFRSCYENRKFLIIDPFSSLDVVSENSIGATPSLGQGERHTLALFASCLAKFIIVDDGRTANHCLKYDVPFINALLVPKVLWLSERITGHMLAEYFSRLKKIGRYSQKIIDFASNCHASALSFFICKE